jgi:hypothetical protein
MRAFALLLALAAAAAVGPASAQPADPGMPASFQSIELRGGGIVTVRHGPTRQVIVRGDNPGRPLRIEGNQLLIDRCSGNCPRGHRIEIEIVTPELSRIAVTDGGRIALEGAFPPQAALTASVSSGGTIDARPLEADRVTAAVDQGGRILARPGRELAASISDGGNVTYWGDPAVRSAVVRGGVVQRGDTADLRLPLAGLDAELVPPPVPAVPPMPPHQTRKH